MNGVDKIAGTKSILLFLKDCCKPRGGLQQSMEAVSWGAGGCPSSGMFTLPGDGTWTLTKNLGAAAIKKLISLAPGKARALGFFKSP